MSEEQPTVLRVPCSVFSRIVGYLSDVRGWHVGKQAEFAERVPFDVSPILEADDVVTP